MRSADLMNGADDNLTPSDLIYLFVDGEASDVERTMLFNALVGDAELQAELADAIRINSAAQQEMFETLPPASVTRALFRRIGDLADQGTTGAAAAVSAAGVAPDRPTVRGTKDRERKGTPRGFPLLTGLLGIVIGLLLAGSNGINTGKKFAETESSQVEAAQGVHATTSPDGLQHKILTRDHLEPNGDGPEQSVENQAVRRNEGRASGPSLSTRILGSTHSSVIPSQDNRTAAATPLTTEAPAEVQSTSEIISGGESASFRQSLLEELVVTSPYFGNNYDRSVVRIEEDDVDTEGLPAISPSPRLESGGLLEEGSGRQLFFFLRGGSQISFHPNRSPLQEATAENLQNLVIGGYYQVNDMHGVGIQGGRDFHPFYRNGGRGASAMLDVGLGSPATNEPIILNHVGGGGIGGNSTIGFGGAGNGADAENLLNTGKDSNQSPIRTPEAMPSGKSGEVGVPTLDPTIEWIGLGYRFRAPGIDRLGLFRPEFHAAIGLSTVGPVARATIGLAWKPGTHVSLVAGVEGAGVLYRLDGETYSSRRLGVVYGVEVGF